MTANSVDPADHTRLIWWAVNRLARRGEDRDEMAGVAAAALVDAARLFDASLGGRFSTYAAAAMRHQIAAWRRREWNYRHCNAPTSVRRGRRRLVLFSELGGDFVRGRNRAFARDDGPVREEWGWLLPFLRVLNQQQRRVVSLRTGIDSRGPLSLEETGKVVGVTRERVRQIEAKAHRRLFEAMAAAGITAAAVAE